MEEYHNLKHKVDEQFEKIFSKHKKEMSCTIGCHDCCAPNLTVTQVEADTISEYLSKNEKLVEELKLIAQENPHQNSRCSLLNANGYCGIYDVRPLV